MKRLVLSMYLLAAFTTVAHAQAKTEVPPVIAGAKPVRTETIKILGKHLEGTWRVILPIET